MTTTGEKMMDTPGPSITMEVERSAMRVVDQPDRTFSHEALEALADEMGLWVRSRVLRTWEERGEAPKRLTVTLHVAIDGRNAV